MTEITIIGGHGKVGLQLSRLLAAQGDTVNAVIRKEEQRQDVQDTGANPVVADVQDMDVAALTELLSGHCLLYTSPSPRDLSTSRMPSSA